MRRYRLNAPNVFVNILIYTVLGLFAIACVLPMWHVLMSSFSDYSALAANKNFLFLPIGKWSTEGYKMVFGHDLLLRGYLNTIFYAVTSTVIGLVLTYIGGYVVSRRDLYWGKAIMIFMLISIFFSGGIIPIFIVVNSLGMMNTIFAVILPTCCSVFNIILMRNAMM